MYEGGWSVGTRVGFTTTIHLSIYHIDVRLMTLVTIHVLNPTTYSGYTPTHKLVMLNTRRRNYPKLTIQVINDQVSK